MGKKMNGATTELAKYEDQGLSIPDAEGLFDLRDNMEGVTPRLPQVGILHQGQVFKMPDGSKVDDVHGVILDTNVCNAWWAESFDASGGGTPPNCASSDATKPDQGDMQQNELCATCPQNRFGSAGRGKACKNMRRLHLWVKGSRLPLRLTLPPSSLRAWDEYATGLANRGIPYPCVETTVTLLADQNKDGIEYSVPEFSFPKDADGNPIPIGGRTDLERIAKLRKAYLQAMRGQRIEATEATAE